MNPKSVDIREAVARIIDPEVMRWWDELEAASNASEANRQYGKRRNRAFAKADQIRGHHAPMSGGSPPAAAKSEGPSSAGWFKMDVLPEVGRKFIALYNDGSGACMFWRHDDGFIDQDGDESAALGEGYDRWAYLPDELEFWCESYPEDRQ